MGRALVQVVEHILIVIIVLNPFVQVVEHILIVIIVLLPAVAVQAVATV